MKNKNDQPRWLLPPAAEDLLPPHAEQFHKMQQDILKIIKKYGYQLIFPPLVEYSSALNIDESPNLESDLVHFTGGGEELGLRADFTPQAVRVDTKMMEHFPHNRLCYSGETFRLRSKNSTHGRSGFHIGAEFFGDKSIKGDIEIIRVALDCLAATKLKRVGRPNLFLSHATFAKRILQSSYMGLTEARQEEYLNLLATKSMDYIKNFAANTMNVKGKKLNPTARGILESLCRLYGGTSLTAKANKLIAPLKDRELEQNLNDIRKVAKEFSKEADIYIDLGELPGSGYSYHNGLVFGVYYPDSPLCFALGGRYDAISKHYLGHNYEVKRGATGFSIEARQLFDYLRTLG